MALTLQEMLKKAKEKGLSAEADTEGKKLTRPWQHDSILFAENKIKPKKESYTNPTQTVHKSYTNRTQSEHKSYTEREKTVHTEKNNLTQNEHKQYTNHTQKETQNHTQTSKQTKVNRLLISGIQKEIILHIYDNCKMYRSLISEPIGKKTLAESLNIKYQSVNNSIQRLVEKGFLMRYQSHKGRIGTTSYELPEWVYKEISENEAKLYTKSNTQGVYSSSNINNTTITKDKNQLPQEWTNIDISPLQSIGFSINNLKQLIKFNNPDVVQDSIHRFAYTLTHDPNVKKDFPNPLRVIMGVLRKGEGWSEPNYESPQDKALRQLLERKKEEKEKRDKRINELVDLEFPEWHRQLTAEEKRKIAPPEKALNTNWNNSPDKLLRDHFANVVLPKRLEEEGML